MKFFFYNLWVRAYPKQPLSHLRELSSLRLIESLGLRPRQGNLKLVFRLFSLMRGLPSIRPKKFENELGISLSRPQPHH